MVRALAGEALGQVIETRRPTISYSRDGDEAAISVGDAMELRARALRLCCDAHAGIGSAGSPTLGRTDHASCAIAVEERRDGRWPAPVAADPCRRTAAFGEFSL